jgi:7-keto-8-aminopelargonate synthetase-like enzyme
VQQTLLCSWPLCFTSSMYSDAVIPLVAVAASSALGVLGAACAARQHMQRHSTGLNLGDYAGIS